MSSNMKKLVLALCLLTITVVAYGAVHFSVVWDHLDFRGGTTNQAQSVDMLRNRVVVGEILGRSTGTETDAVVKAYNRMTGNLVWTDETPGRQVFVQIANGTAVAVVAVPFAGNVLNIRIRAYDLMSGAVHWTNEV